MKSDKSTENCKAIREYFEREVGACERRGVMKLILLSAIFVVSLMFFSANAEAVSIEPDGYIGSGLSASHVGTLVATIHASGYPCNSVTIVRKLWGKTGFKVKCNRSTYSYEVIINEYGDYRVLPD